MVSRRVLDGGVGGWYAGMVERSSFRPCELREAEEEEREGRGEGSMVALCIFVKLMVGRLVGGDGAVWSLS